MSKSYDFTATLQELDAGVLNEKLSRAVTDAAQGVIYHGQGKKKGKVTLELTIDQINDSRQINVTHKISSSVPTPKGKVTEEDTTSTALYVGKDGALSIIPDNQLDFLTTQNQEKA